MLSDRSTSSRSIWKSVLESNKQQKTDWLYTQASPAILKPQSQECLFVEVWPGERVIDYPSDSPDYQSRA